MCERFSVNILSYHVSIAWMGPTTSLLLADSSDNRYWHCGDVTRKTCSILEDSCLDSYNSLSCGISRNLGGLGLECLLLLFGMSLLRFNVSCNLLGFFCLNFIDHDGFLDDRRSHFRDRFDYAIFGENRRWLFGAKDLLFMVLVFLSLLC